MSRFGSTVTIKARQEQMCVYLDSVSLEDVIRKRGNKVPCIFTLKSKPRCFRAHTQVPLKLRDEDTAADALKVYFYPKKKLFPASFLSSNEMYVIFTLNQSMAREGVSAIVVAHQKEPVGIFTVKDYSSKVKWEWRGVAPSHMIEEKGTVSILHCHRSFCTFCLILRKIFRLLEEI